MKVFKLLGIASVVVALTACGGGSGSTDEDNGVAQPLPSVRNGKATLLAGSLTGECGVISRNGAMTFHQGELWIAERGCNGSSRVQVVNPDTGAVRTHVQVMSDPNAARATGFSDPTGMAFDDQGNLYVADAAGELGRWSYEGMTPPAVKPPAPGHAAGVWKITPSAMEILAGVMQAGNADGMGEAASFTSPNSLVFANEILYSADGSAVLGYSALYTNDNTYIRGISLNGEVVDSRVRSDRFWPLSTNPRGEAHIPVDSSASGWGFALWHAFQGNWPAAGLPEGTGKIVAIGDNNTVFTSGLAPAPDRPTPFSIYRNSDIVVENVQYLNNFTIDDKGNLYIQQRNAIVKVEFD